MAMKITKNNSIEFSSPTNSNFPDGGIVTTSTTEVFIALLPSGNTLNTCLCRCRLVNVTPDKGKGAIPQFRLSDEMNATTVN